MDKALVGGRLVDAVSYRQMSNEQRERAGKPICRECGAEVAPYGMTSLVAQPRFDHPDAPEHLDPLDDCSLARRSDRLRWFGQDEQDRSRGARIREAFFGPEFLRRAYSFSLSRTGRGSLPLALFGSAIERADRLDIWSYVGIEPWCIPHILLLLADYRTPRGDPFHFSLVRTARLGVIWDGPFPVRIVKLFSDSGRPFETMSGSPNPALILQRDVAEAEADWMGTGMTRTLMKFR